MKSMFKCEKFHRQIVDSKYRYLTTAFNAEFKEAARKTEEIRVNEIATGLPTLQHHIKKCATQKMMRDGKIIHGKIFRLGFESDILTSNMLINMYCKCGVRDDARKVFDEMPERTVVSWNTIIGSLSQNGNAEEALFMFKEMHREGSVFSEFTISGVLCASAGKFAVIECKQLHSFAIKVLVESNVFVATALLDVYAKCNFMEDAWRIFDSMTERNDVTWTSMVVGLVRNELYEEALLLFRRSKRAGLDYNQFIVSSAVSACVALAALIEGNQVHAVVWKSNFNANSHVASSLVDLYAKCGMIKEAYLVFFSIDEKNVVLWNTMISGFARHGKTLEAMILFEKMQQGGLLPNELTYVSMLSACGHIGLVERGRKYFDMIAKEHNLLPNVFHYSCMVDILGRSGLVHEAKNLIEKMTFDATPSMWGSLLASSKVFGNVELAEIAAKHLFEMEPSNAGNHVLLSNTYAALRRWENVASTRKLLKDSKVKKERGKSWIEIKDKVHTFMAGERKHPRISEICMRLDDLLGEMRKLGYKGESEHDFHDIEESQKQELLKHHSEKLAFTLGLMCLPSGVTIRIMKNLRICGDCHSFMKMASKVTGRHIIVRDNNRFHHFVNGFCSCSEFW